MQQRRELASDCLRFDAVRHAALCHALRENEAYRALLQRIFYPNIAPTQFEYLAVQLTAGFEALSALGANFRLHQDFFMALIRNLNLSEPFVALLNFLKQHAIDMVHGSRILKSIIDHPSCVSKIHTGLAALLSWPVAFHQDPALFENTVHYICERQDSHHFVQCLALLKSYEILFERD